MAEEKLLESLFLRPEERWKMILANEMKKVQRFTKAS